MVESGPFTSLEQAMLATGLEARARNHVFGVYNAVAALAGRSARWRPVVRPSSGRPASACRPTNACSCFVPIALLGAGLARSLSPAVEAESWREKTRVPALSTSRRTVRRLAGLFASTRSAAGLSCRR